MIDTLSAPHDPATAVADFVRRVAARSLAARAARLETRLSWPGRADAVFETEAAMKAALRSDGRLRPAHEVTWVLGDQAAAPSPWMEVRAFDAEGQLLLTERWVAE